MGLAVVTIVAGGMPVVETPRGAPVTEATNKYGIAVTKVVDKPGLPVIFVGVAAPPPPMFSGIPLSWDDPRFSGNAVSNSVTLPNGGALSNKSITDTGATASVVLLGSGTLDNLRVNSREGVRIGGSGTINISNSYLESTGIAGDHADTIQAYAPGGVGNVVINNTTIKAHDAEATAGMFVADNYAGNFTFNNVVFWGGPYGLRLAADGPGNIYASFTNVYFVGPFAFQPFLFENTGAVMNVTHWENVRNATIAGGVLVPGSVIPLP